MKLSVVIPVYNTASTLCRCVESVIKALPDDSEVVLVDDCSTDSSPALCDKAAGHPEVRAIHRRNNGGLSAARNTGIDVAQGEYITFVDSDDFISTDSLCGAVARLDNESATDFVEYPIFVHYGGSDARLLKFKAEVFDSMVSYWLDAQAYAHCYACNKVFRRRLFNHLRFAEGRAFEDVIMLPRLLQSCRRVALTTQGCYYYCSNAAGITMTATGQQLSDLLEAHCHVWKEGYLLKGRERSAEAARYYAHVVNIQLSVALQTGNELMLPELPYGGSWKLRLLHVLGMKNLCKLYRKICLFLHRF